MTSILAFGDSNTYGFQPLIGGRYKENERYTGILRNTLGEDYVIIEEGLNGRTANEFDEKEPFLNGRNYAIACVMSHRPVNVLIVMLGTNDCKSRYNKSAEQIASSVVELTRDMKKMLDENQAERVKVILISPRSMDERIVSPDSGMDKQSVSKSEQLGELYDLAAQKEGWKFINADEIVGTVGADGCHLTKEGHLQLAKAIMQVI